MTLQYYDDTKGLLHIILRGKDKCLKDENQKVTNPPRPLGLIEFKEK